METTTTQEAFIQSSTKSSTAPSAQAWNLRPPPAMAELGAEAKDSSTLCGNHSLWTRATHQKTRSVLPLGSAVLDS